jgi:hypothetical protein
VQRLLFCEADYDCFLWMKMLDVLAMKFMCKTLSFKVIIVFSESTKLCCEAEYDSTL